jgi:hypothetical protein
MVTEIGKAWEEFPASVFREHAQLRRVGVIRNSLDLPQVFELAFTSNTNL